MELGLCQGLICGVRGVQHGRFIGQRRALCMGSRGREPRNRGVSCRFRGGKHVERLRTASKKLHEKASISEPMASERFRGANDLGQLGLGDTQPRSTPAKLGGAVLGVPFRATWRLHMEPLGPSSLESRRILSKLA